MQSQKIFRLFGGHVTKEGTVAGPAVLAHIVDTVLWFEGENVKFKTSRSVKNRFGSTDEVGIFSMEDKGLISLDNPEKLFLGNDVTQSRWLCHFYPHGRFKINTCRNTVLSCSHKDGLSKTGCTRNRFKAFRDVTCSII